MNKLYKNTLAVTICLLLIGCDITDFVDHRTGFRFINYTNKDIAILSEFIETNKISKKSSYFLIPYLSYGLYAFILMTTVYFMNI